MFSLMAKLNSKYFWEKLLIPPFIFFFQKLFPFEELTTQKMKSPLLLEDLFYVNLRFLKRKTWYESIKNKVIDDCNIARFLKKKEKFG